VRGLLIAYAAGFLLLFFGAPMAALLAFDLQGLRWLRAWTWLTYPFVVGDPLTLLLQGYWLYVVGGSLERSWGSRRFAVVFLALSVIAALAFIPAYALFQRPPALAGLMLPNSALTVAWAALDPDMELLLFGAVRLRLKLLALIDVLLVYFFYGLTYNPLGPVIALFTLAAPAAAWLYVRRLPRWSLGGVPRRTQPRRRQPPREAVRGANPLRSRREQEEIARLRRLLGEDDEPAGGRR